MGLGTDLELSLWKYINHPDFTDRHRTSPKHFTRQSRLSFSTLVSLVLQKMTRSLQVEANHLGDLLNAEPVSKQALSAARQKIHPSAFQEMHRHVISEYYQKEPPGTWKGYRVFGGDGTTLQFPHRGDLPAVFGDYFERTTLSRVMQYVELTSGVIVAADLQPYTRSEKTIAAELLPNVVSTFKGLGCSKQIFVYDRGFPAHAFAQRHVNEGVHFLYRVQRRFSNEISVIVSNGEEADFITRVKRGSIDYQARIIVRYLSSGQPLVLMTSLTDRTEHSVDDLLELYRLRWRSEESYKFQKVLLQLDNMHHRSYQVAVQEFWATATLACLMCVRFQEQEELDAKSQGRRRHTIINRSVVFGSLKTYYLRAFLGEISFDEFDKRFIKLCKRHRCSSKPSRHYPRLSVDTRKTRHCHRRHA